MNGLFDWGKDSNLQKKYLEDLELFEQAAKIRALMKGSGGVGGGSQSSSNMSGVELSGMYSDVFWLSEYYNGGLGLDHL